jgi:hypothetical protein
MSNVFQTKAFARYSSSSEMVKQMDNDENYGERQWNSNKHHDILSERTRLLPTKSHASKIDPPIDDDAPIIGRASVFQTIMNLMKTSMGE